MREKFLRGRPSIGNGGESYKSQSFWSENLNKVTTWFIDSPQEFDASYCSLFRNLINML